MQNKYRDTVMQLYATLAEAHIALLDEILDAATSKVCRKTATRASSQICATVYHLIDDTGIMPEPMSDEVRAMELRVFPSIVGGYTGFGLYPAN